jgi:UDP-glucuronate decarboxylase
MNTEGLTGPVNIGNPNEFTIRELADLVVSLTGSRSDIVHRPLPQDDPVQRQPDISLAAEKLGWQPAVPVEEGLVSTIDYFEQLLAEDRQG